MEVVLYPPSWLWRGRVRVDVAVDQPWIAQRAQPLQSPLSSLRAREPGCVACLGLVEYTQASL